MTDGKFKYVRYVDLSLRFQDTILGHLYGVSHIVAFPVRWLMFCEAYECGLCANAVVLHDLT